MNEIVPFAFNGARVRTLVLDGEVHWVATDVAEILGYRMASDATRLLDGDEKGTHTVRTPGGDQSISTVTEAGIYSLIMRSKSEVAKPFRRWVTHEVLPTLRRTGRYESPASPAPEITALTEVKTELEVLDLARSLGALTLAETRFHGRKALARAGIVEPPAAPETRAESALRWMERHELGVGDTISLKQIYQGLDGRTWCRRVVDAEDVVNELVEAGYLRKLPKPAPKRGRPPSPRFELVRPPRHLAVVPDGGAAS